MEYLYIVIKTIIKESLYLMLYGEIPFIGKSWDIDTGYNSYSYLLTFFKLPQCLFLYTLSLTTIFSLGLES